MRKFTGYQVTRCPDCGKNKVVPMYEEIIEEKPQFFMDKIGESCDCEKEEGLR